MTSIAAVGSSSFEPGAPLVAALAAELGEPVAAFGVRGSRIASWVERDLTALAASQPARIFVYLGANDPAVTVADIRAVDARLKAITPRVDWLALPPYETEPYKLRSQALARAARAAGVQFVTTRYRVEEGDLQADGVHMTARGARRFAAEVRTALSRRRGFLFFGVAVALAFVFAAAGGHV